MVLNMDKTYEMLFVGELRYQYLDVFRLLNEKHGLRYLELHLRKKQKIGVYTLKKC